MLHKVEGLLQLDIKRYKKKEDHTYQISVTTLFPHANHFPSFPAWMTPSSFQHVSEGCLFMLLPLGTYLLPTCLPHHAHHSYSMHTFHHLMPIVLTLCLFLIIYTLFTICIPCSFLIIYTHIPYVFHTSTMPSPRI